MVYKSNRMVFDEMQDTIAPGYREYGKQNDNKIVSVSGVMIFPCTWLWEDSAVIWLK